MLPRFLLSGTLVFLLITAAQAAPKPKECPYPVEVAYDLDKIEEALKGAPSCDAAFEVFSLCMMGATSDVAMSGIVIAKCEQDFVPKLSKAQQRAYEKATDRCERKSAQYGGGSESRAMAALCEAEVARSHARRWRKAKPPRRS